MPIRAIFAAILVACCWGGNFIAAKFSMMDFPPILTVFLRFALLSLLLLPFVVGKKMPSWRDMMILSLTMIVIQFGLVFTGMHMGLSITSVIIATQLGVPFSCLLAAIAFKDYLGPWRAGGLMIAFMGVMIVAGTPNASEHWGAFALCMMGAFSWALANIHMKRMPHLSSVSFLFWPGLVALPPLLLLSLWRESPSIAMLTHAHLLSWVGIAYSAIMSSVVAYGLWNLLITRYDISQVVPYSLLVPVVGIAGGMAVFGEPVSMQVLLGAALTMIGVAVITMRRPRLAEMEP
jgi:O-acetylserine/cysteine efflux transporter